MSEAVPTGGTVRDSYVAIERVTGVTPPQLMPPPAPPAGRHLLDWFNELSASRSGNGYGPNPISYSELLAWARLTHRRPSPGEIAILRRLDEEVIRHAAAEADKRETKKAQVVDGNR